MKYFFLFIALLLAPWTVLADGTPTAPATQAEVNAGTLTTKFVSPKTLSGYTGTNVGGGFGATNIFDQTAIAIDTIYTNSTASNLWVSASFTWTTSGNNGINLRIDQLNDGTFEEAHTFRLSSAFGNEETTVGGWVRPGGRYKFETMAGAVTLISTTSMRMYTATSGGGGAGGGSSGTATNLTGNALTQSTNIAQSIVNTATNALPYLAAGANVTITQNSGATGVTNVIASTGGGGGGSSASNYIAALVVTNGGGGVLDDWLVVSNGIAQLNAGNIRTLYFPPGTYRVSTNLPDITLNGAEITGQGASIITTNPGAKLFSIRAHGIWIHDLTIGGPGNVSNATPQSVAIRTSANASGGWLAGPLIQRVFVTNFDTGIALSNTVAPIIDHSWTYACAHYGIRIDNCDNAVAQDNFVGNSYTNVNTEFGASKAYAGTAWSQTNAWGIYVKNAGNQAGAHLSRNNVGQTGKGIFNDGGKLWALNNVVETLYGVSRNMGMIECTNSAVFADGNGFVSVAQGTIPNPTNNQIGGLIVLNNCALDECEINSLNGASGNNGATNSIGVYGTTTTSTLPRWNGIAANVVLHSAYGDAGTVFTTPTITLQTVLKENVTEVNAGLSASSTYYGTTDSHLKVRDTGGHTLLVRDGSLIDGVNGLGLGLQALNDAANDVMTLSGSSFRLLGNGGNASLYGGGAWTGNGAGLTNLNPNTSFTNGPLLVFPTNIANSYLGLGSTTNPIFTTDGQFWTNMSGSNFRTGTPLIIASQMYVTNPGSATWVLFNTNGAITVGGAGVNSTLTTNALTIGGLLTAGVLASPAVTNNGKQTLTGATTFSGVHTNSGIMYYTANSTGPAPTWTLGLAADQSIITNTPFTTTSGWVTTTTNFTFFDKAFTNTLGVDVHVTFTNATAGNAALFTVGGSTTTTNLIGVFSIQPGTQWKLPARWITTNVGGGFYYR